MKGEKLALPNFYTKSAITFFVVAAVVEIINAVSINPHYLVAHARIEFLFIEW